MMTRLIGQLEEERRKLNELGKKSLEQGIPLFKNEAVQAQSRKVDELIVHLHRKRIGREHQLR
jgi:hypothetical protein